MHPTTAPLIKRGALAAAVLCGASLLSGCASPTPRMDHLFGQSVTRLTAAQTMHPNAGLNRDPVAGIDGASASAAYEQYQKSFSAPVPQTNSFTIGVGK